MDEELQEIWNFIIKKGIATDDELDLVTGIDGLCKEVLEDIIYYRTGYRDYEQIKEEVD